MTYDSSVSQEMFSAQRVRLIELVFLWGGMNSWFLYEFMVCLMGSISANIADNLLNIDYAMSIMVLGSSITAPGS
jgi:hypothetical protein